MSNEASVCETSFSTVSEPHSSPAMLPQNLSIFEIFNSICLLSKLHILSLPYHP